MSDLTPDYVLEVVCEHDGRDCDASPRRLTLVGHVAPPSTGIRIGFREWREFYEPGETRAPVAKSFYDVYRERVAKMADSGSAGPEVARRVEADLERNGMGSARWDFECADCGDTERRRESALVDKFEVLRANAVPRLTLRGLRSILEM